MNETERKEKESRALVIYYEILELARPAAVVQLVKQTNLTNEEAIELLNRRGFPPAFEGFVLNVAFELWKREISA